MPQNNHSRVFFALWPDELLQRRCADLALTLQLRCGGKLVPAHNIHLTLLFVGEVEKTKIAELIEAANSVRAKFFALQLDRVGAFRKSKAVWLAPAQASSECTLLVNNLQNVLWQAGFGFDSKPFVPHVTLLRKAGWLDESTLNEAIDWQVNGFALVRSLSEIEGVRYEVLKKFAN
jgi:2'-5' RNA ligase